jgi:hypothetical protein
MCVMTLLHIRVYHRDVIHMCVSMIDTNVSHHTYVYMSHVSYTHMNDDSH